jgi:parvulin-like peptidyl-prolyl isomerase
MWLSFILLIGSACSAAAGPAAPVNTPPRAAAADAEVKYAIVAQGDPMVGGSVDSMTLAVRGDAPEAALLATLPPDAQAQLQAELAREPSALLLVLYGGRQPGSGYTIKIESIGMQNGRLQVTYKIAAPEGGAAAVLTYPYLIVKLSQTDMPADQVEFKAAP